MTIFCLEENKSQLIFFLTSVAIGLSANYSWCAKRCLYINLYVLVLRIGVNIPLDVLLSPGLPISQLAIRLGVVPVKPPHVRRKSHKSTLGVTHLKKSNHSLGLGCSPLPHTPAPSFTTTLDDFVVALIITCIISCPSVSPLHKVLAALGTTSYARTLSLASSLRRVVGCCRWRHSACVSGEVMDISYAHQEACRTARSSPLAPQCMTVGTTYHHSREAEWSQSRGCNRLCCHWEACPKSKASPPQKTLPPRIRLTHRRMSKH